jgi:hypothetical protein
MKRSAWGLCAVLLALPMSIPRAQDLPWAIWQSPAQLAKLDAGDIVLERSSHCLDGCRFDRSNPAAKAATPIPSDGFIAAARKSSCSTNAVPVP